MTDARKTVLLIAAAIVLIAVVAAVVYVVHGQGQLIRDAYLAEQTSLLIVRYMDADEDQFPRSWDDLESAYEGSDAEKLGITIDEMSKQVEVDFEVLNTDPNRQPFIRSRATLGDPDPSERVRQRIKQLSLSRNERGDRPD